VEYFNCLISMITNDATCAREINPGLPWQTQRRTRRRLLSQANFGLYLRKKVAKLCIWGISLGHIFGAHLWGTSLGHIFVWCWNLDTSESRSGILGKFRNVVLESIEKIGWVLSVKNEV
jgi:hypothetical protein